jgi:hypothetical protein
MPGFWRGVVVAGGLMAFFARSLAQAADRPPLSVSLEQQLLQETPAALAQAARQQGDLNRGAILFYQPYLTCTKCHSLDQQTTPLGPDLTQPGPEVNDVYLVEAVLQPSKAVKKGFEPIVVITDEGKSLTEDIDHAELLRELDEDAFQRGYRPHDAAGCRRLWATPEIAVAGGVC